MKEHFFITTAIDYVNAIPHLGHALEKIQADVLARYHRFLGEDVFFLTGTDENSLKNVQAAKKEGIAVQKLVDRNSEKFRQLKKILNLSFDDFIRTTEKRHIKGVQKLWQACQKDIYKKTYRGLYCVGCEEFYKEKELVNGFCPEHRTKLALVEEENYFFRLSKYQNQLKDLIEKDKVRIFPQARKNEVLSFINSGLEDICISRSAERAGNWGIDVPGDASQKIWVWFDALSNYLNALGYAENGKKFKKYWPVDLHVIGKGILRFHAVYWPAILLSANLPLLKEIFVHGYITFSGQKMSKSLGNVVDPFELVKKYGVDAVRYFLLREIPSTEDGDFTEEKFIERYNGDLASGIGNTVRRILMLIEEKTDGIVPEYKPLIASTIRTDSTGFHDGQKELNNLKDSILREQVRPFEKWFSGGFYFNFCLEIIADGFKKIDKDVEDKKPWKWDSVGQLDKNILYSWLELIRMLSHTLLPFIPDTANEIFKQLGLDPKKEEKKTIKKAIGWGGLKPGAIIKKGKPLFPRFK